MSPLPRLMALAYVVAVLAFGARLGLELAGKPMEVVVIPVIVAVVGFFLVASRFDPPGRTLRATGNAFVAPLGRFAGAGVVMIGWAVGGLTLSTVLLNVMVIVGGVLQFWPRVTLSPTHLKVRHLVPRRVPWENIPQDGVQRFKLSGVEIDMYSGLGHWRRLVVPPKAFNIRDEFLAAAIDHYVRHPEHRAAIGTPQELIRLQAALGEAPTIPRRPSEKLPEWLTG